MLKREAEIFALVESERVFPFLAADNFARVSGEWITPAGDPAVGDML